MSKATEIAVALAITRVRTVVLEIELQKAINEELAKHGSLRDMAKRLGFSAQYVCDVRHGRRKVSKTFLERMAKLPKKKA